MTKDHAMNMQRLNDILDDWQRQVEPHMAAACLANVMHKNAMDDPDYCALLISGHETSAMEGAGLDINDILAFGLMVLADIKEATNG